MATGSYAMYQCAGCCEGSAAGCTSVRLDRIMDTVILAVSIIIVLILGLVLYPI